MQTIYSQIPQYIKEIPPVFAVIVEKKGSAPQNAGASALIGPEGILAGTLGGGLLEAEALRRASKAIKSGRSQLFTFDLNKHIDDPEGAICGGVATILIDTSVIKHEDIFLRVGQAMEQEKGGTLITRIGKKDITVERYWIGEGEKGSQELPEDVAKLVITTGPGPGKVPASLKETEQTLIFIEYLQPLQELIIAGAGHVGKALAHYASRVGFAVTIADDRPEFANRQNIPEAQRFLPEKPAEALKNIPAGKKPYVVIVTRDHHSDAETLRACLDKKLPYTGMIGSRRKIKQIREKLLKNGWATPSAFDSIHAPVGLDIGAESVEEIAVSITAELISVRNRLKKRMKKNAPSAVILAAGASSRMGENKMLLPWGNKTIIEQVVENTIQAGLEKIIVVLGAECERIGRQLQNYPVDLVYNKDFNSGMVSSVRAGIRLLGNNDGGVMVLLGDQPMIRPETIRKLSDAYLQSEKGIAVTRHHGKRGHPVIFHRKYFTTITSPDEIQTLKDILTLSPGDIEEMDTESDDILKDIDTKNDYLEELKKMKGHE